MVLPKSVNAASFMSPPIIDEEWTQRLQKGNEAAAIKYLNDDRQGWGLRAHIIREVGSTTNGIVDKLTDAQVVELLQLKQAQQIERQKRYPNDPPEIKWDDIPKPGVAEWAMKQAGRLTEYFGITGGSTTIHGPNPRKVDADGTVTPASERVTPEKVEWKGTAIITDNKGKAFGI